MKNLTSVVLVFTCLVPSLMAQQTGSFNTQLNFNNESRNISAFVPSGYSSTTPCPLVIALHGMGDNANNYRNALVNNLYFAAAFPNTILICPDGGSDNTRSFHVPVGDEAIIAESLAFIKNTYAVDTSQIILQGFSLGGYSALQYGLAHPNMFKGLILNTPAIQGVKQALNQSPAVTIPYSNVAALPIFITLGQQDFNYVAPIDSAVVKLIEQNARLSYKRFNGGHNVPSFTNYDYLSFFNHPYSTGTDIYLAKTDLPVRSCAASISPRVLVQNKGEDTIKSIWFSYGAGNAITQQWQGNIIKGQHAYIQLNNYTFTGEGNHTLEIKADSVNHFADSNPEDNSSSAKIQIQTVPKELPYSTNFQNSTVLNEWTTKASGNYVMPFEHDADAHALTTFNTIFLFDNAGAREEALTPSFNISAMSQAFLRFSTDYNYTAYSASVMGLDTVFADTLEVLVSLDCGVTYTPIFKKGGSALSGYAEPIMNPLTMQSVYKDLDSSKYVHHLLDVSAYSGNPNVQFKFSYISGLGGYIYLDNVSLNNSPLNVKRIDSGSLHIYPNPAKDMLYVTFENSVINEMSLWDNMGRKVLGRSGNNSIIAHFNLRNIPAGSYIVQITTPRGVAVRKIQVVK